MDAVLAHPWSGATTKMHRKKHDTFAMPGTDVISALRGWNKHLLWDSSFMHAATSYHMQLQEKNIRSFKDSKKNKQNDAKD